MLIMIIFRSSITALLNSVKFTQYINYFNNLKLSVEFKYFFITIHLDVILWKIYRFLWYLSTDFFRLKSMKNLCSHLFIWNNCNKQNPLSTYSITYCLLITIFDRFSSYIYFILNHHLISQANLS